MSRRDNLSGLLSLVWPFVAVVLVQALVAGFSIQTLSSVRAFVGGESFWSKGQKDAVLSLHRYIDSQDARHYDAFLLSLGIPLADRDARLAVERGAADSLAEAAFVEGRNDPVDAPGMVRLLRRFGWSAPIREAAFHWRAGDRLIVDLKNLGRTIDHSFERGQSTPEDRKAWDLQLYRLNRDLAPHAEAFARTLGEGSRLITHLLLAANIATAIALILLAFWRTRKLLRQRYSAERALDAERRRAEVTLASIGEAVIGTDMTGRVAYLNTAAERLLGIEGREAIGMEAGEVLRLARDGAGSAMWMPLDAQMGGSLAEAGDQPLQLTRRDGGSIMVSAAVQPLTVDGSAAGSVIVLHDMTRERAYIDRLSWQAAHDALTNLANRRDFEERLTAALATIQRRGTQQALMLLDLDQFKVVNDTNGHAAGDALLCKVADGLRRTMAPTDLVARIGGDEFAILVQGRTAEEAEQAAEAVRQCIETIVFSWNGSRFSISASIGLLWLDAPGLTAEEALRAADLACYMAKEHGRNRVQIYRPSDVAIQERYGEMAWVQRLRAALEEDRFRLYAQELAAVSPDCDPGIHIELLLRLRDERGELVLPGSFIPAAERYGLMPHIDRWVVRAAVDILSERAANGGAAIATCAINLSGATLNDASFVDFIIDQFAGRPIAPSSICFEITETSAIADLGNATRFMDALGARGFRFALDDFGAGMSSFGYLKRLPVDYLKIDGGFVKDMLDDRIDRAMVEMIAHLGRVMGKKTVAEFAESDAIVQALRVAGVDFVQGYAIARPVEFSAGAAFAAAPARTAEARQVA